MKYVYMCILDFMAADNKLQLNAYISNTINSSTDLKLSIHIAIRMFQVAVLLYI